MTMALPEGRSVVVAGFAAIAGAGLALGFTVLDSTTSTWILVLVAAVTLGVPPVFAGWLSPGRILPATPRRSARRTFRCNSP